MLSTRLVVGTLLGVVFPATGLAQLSSSAMIISPSASAPGAPNVAAANWSCIGSVTAHDGWAFERITGMLRVDGPRSTLAHEDFNQSTNWSGSISFLVEEPGWYTCRVGGEVQWHGGAIEQFSALDTFEYTCADRDDTGTGIQAFACDPPILRTFHHDACPTHPYEAYVLLGGYSTANSCLGRCGSGCNDMGTRVYSYDCGDHDTCCRDHQECYSPNDPRCGDEWLEASDDFAAGTWDCDRGGPYAQPRVQQTALRQQREKPIEVQQPIGRMPPPLTLAAAAEKAKTGKGGGLTMSEKAELATRGQFTASQSGDAVTAHFALEDLKASITSTPRPQGTFAVYADLEGWRVSALIDPAKQAVTLDGGGKRSLDARTKVLLTAFTVRLGAEGWAGAKTDPRAKEYAYRIANLLAEAPVGYKFGRYSSEGQKSPPRPER